MDAKLFPADCFCCALKTYVSTLQTATLERTCLPGQSPLSVRVWVQVPISTTSIRALIYAANVVDLYTKQDHALYDPSK